MRMEGLEPTRLTTTVSKTVAATNYATPALLQSNKFNIIFATSNLFTESVANTFELVAGELGNKGTGGKPQSTYFLGCESQRSVDVVISCDIFAFCC